PMDRLVAVADPLSGRTEYAYDSSGNLVSVIDLRGSRTSYSYDSRNRLVGVVDPLQRTLRVSYDSRGDVIEVMTKKGDLLTFNYDTRRQLVRKVTPDHVVQYGHDINGNLILAEDSDVRLTFTYSPFDDLVEATTGSNTLHLNGGVLYDYDRLGRVAGLH